MKAAEKIFWILVACVALVPIFGRAQEIPAQARPILQALPHGTYRGVSVENQPDSDECHVVVAVSTSGDELTASIDNANGGHIDFTMPLEDARLIVKNGVLTLKRESHNFYQSIEVSNLDRHGKAGTVILSEDNYSRACYGLN